jgi:hypothetical protein
VPSTCPGRLGFADQPDAYQVAFARGLHLERLSDAVEEAVEIVELGAPARKLGGGSGADGERLVVVATSYSAA